MESMTVRKNEILRKMAAIEFHPASIEEEASLTNRTKLPLSRVTAMGIAFEPVVSVYKKCYDQIEGYSKTSIQSHILNGLSIASRIAGKALEKVPVIASHKWMKL